VRLTLNASQDIRHALRLLRKSPAFTFIALLLLSLGIGANTAIFTLLDQAVLRSLPVKEPNRLVLLRYSGEYPGHSFNRNDIHFYFSYPMYRDLRDQNSVFSGLTATAWIPVGVQWHNQPELADSEFVSGNYFDVLGVQPALGRLFVASDDLTRDGNPVVVLSFNYWRRRFDLDPHVVGQDLSINGHPFVVIGVAAPGFHSAVQGDHPSIFVPMAMKHEIAPGMDGLDERRSQWLNIIGRLKPGITHAQAQAGIETVWHSIRAEEMKSFPHASQQFRNAFLNNSRLFLENGAKGVPAHGPIPETLLIIMGMAGLMALMLCANIASLLIVRVARRTREISVRYALGARRGRLIQQLLAEGLLLGIAGGLVGIVLAPQISKVLIRTIWSSDAAKVTLNSHLDLRILTFNFGLALFVSVLFSLAPALQFWRPDVTQALKQQATTISGGSSLRRATVAVQIGITLLLLTGTGLFVRTLHNLESTDLGFATDHLVKFEVDPSLAGYEPSKTRALYKHILEKLASLPGARSAAATQDPMLADNNWGSNITISGYQPAEHEDMNVEWSRVSAGFLSTMKMPLVAGRDLNDGDRDGTAKVAAVNETFARHFFGQPQNALGHYLCQGAGNVKPDIEIVGVVADSKHTTIQEAILRNVFTPYLQEPHLDQVSFGMTFYIRTWQEPKTAESAIRGAMQAIDPNLVLGHLGTMREQIEGNMTDQRVIAFLAASFGFLGALMAAIGIYGVLAFSTAQRTREIGIRIALGATRVEVVSMVLSEVTRLAAIGLATGLPLCFALARTVRSEVFQLSVYDPLTLCIAAVIIVALALFAAAPPAFRAAKVDPMLALRYE
jgi:putative ABC transport system permease protein